MPKNQLRRVRFLNRLEAKSQAVTRVSRLIVSPGTVRGCSRDREKLATRTERHLSRNVKPNSPKPREFGNYFGPLEVGDA